MKRKITIYIGEHFLVRGDYNGLESPLRFEVYRDYDDDRTLRDVVFEVLEDEARERGNWVDLESLRENPIGFDLVSDKDGERHKINYALRKDGQIYFLQPLEEFRQDWSFGEVDGLSSGDYIKGDPRNIQATFAEGLGGVQEVFDWVAFVANIITILGPTVGVILWARKRFVSGKKAKKVDDEKVISLQKNIAASMDRMKKNNNLRYPQDVRNLFDTKTPWTLNEVKWRLGVEDDVALSLLYALGYVPKGSKWFLGTTKDAIEKRSLWLKSEESNLIRDEYGNPIVYMG